MEYIELVNPEIVTPEFITEELSAFETSIDQCYCGNKKSSLVRINGNYFITISDIINDDDFREIAIDESHLDGVDICYMSDDYILIELYNSDITVIDINKLKFHTITLKYDPHDVLMFNNEIYFTTLQHGSAIFKCDLYGNNHIRYDISSCYPQVYTFTVFKDGVYFPWNGESNYRIVEWNGNITNFKLPENARNIEFFGDNRVIYSIDKIFYIGTLSNHVQVKLNITFSDHYNYIEIHNINESRWGITIWFHMVYNQNIDYSMYYISTGSKQKNARF